MKSIILALTILIVSPSFAFHNGFKNKRNNYTKLDISSSEKGIYTLDFHSHAATMINVNIYDEKGNFIFSEKVGVQRSFTKNFNLSDLPSGKYKMELISNDSKLTKEILHSKPQVAIAARLESKVRRMKDSKEYELHINSSSFDKVWVYVFDGNEKVVHKEELAINKNVVKTYNLSAFESDDFSFVIKTKESSFKPKDFTQEEVLSYKN